MSRGFKWKTNEGHALAQCILHASPLLYDPHNYQIEGICCSLDSTDLRAITPTGHKKNRILYYVSDTLRGTTDARRDDRGPGVGSAQNTTHIRKPDTFLPDLDSVTVLVMQMHHHWMKVICRWRNEMGQNWLQRRSLCKVVSAKGKRGQ
ncbi:hypothetical protein B0H14DRAFT_3159827 [Mycena olivaceomarginata]|nr:hypothetical protein B0H14DRAFT_3159827 [Mycena olivaceomarginata]